MLKLEIGKRKRKNQCVEEIRNLHGQKSAESLDKLKEIVLRVITHVICSNYMINSANLALRRRLRRLSFPVTDESSFQLFRRSPP